MKLIDADDLYQKCIEIQLKKRNRYFDIDDVIKLIKKASASDVLDKIRAEIEALNEKVSVDYKMCLDKSAVLQIIDKYMEGANE